MAGSVDGTGVALTPPASRRGRIKGSRGGSPVPSSDDAVDPDFRTRFYEVLDALTALERDVDAALTVRASGSGRFGRRIPGA